MHSELPKELYTCAQTRAIDRAAIASGIPGIILMKRAGQAAFKVLQQLWPKCTPVIFCGAGNNGGDGFVIAALAAQQGITVQVYFTGSDDSLSEDARHAFEFAQREGVDIRSVDAFDPEEYKNTACVVVDALLGTGFRGELKERLAKLVRDIRRSELAVFAIDIPSGLEGDSGWAGKDAVRADATITFVGVKRGLLTARGPALCGRLLFDDLAIPADIYRQFPGELSLITRPIQITRREADAHKGDFGHVLVVGGDLGMGGAAMLAAESALRSGAGLVSLATHREHVSAALARLPELMVRGLIAGPQLQELAEKASVIVVGPGLGQSAWSRQMLYFALAAKKPMVIDADALNIIARDKLSIASDAPLILTPHPGEAARLLALTTEEVQRDRFGSVSALRERFNAVIVLKGAGTLVHDGRQRALAAVGNPGMAVGGMGDILSGIVGGLMAQGVNASEAAKSAVCIHGNAGDRAAQTGQRGIKASDLMSFIKEGVNLS